jgi:hypothetical protein
LLYIDDNKDVTGCIGGVRLGCVMVMRCESEWRPNH